MTMLSMELRKWIITLHNNDYLTSYSISFRHITDIRNAATASKLNVAHVTTILKQQKQFGAQAIYTITTNNKHQYWDPMLAAVSILNTYVVHDLNGLNSYTYFVYCV